MRSHRPGAPGVLRASGPVSSISPALAAAGIGRRPMRPVTPVQQTTTALPAPQQVVQGQQQQQPGGQQQTAPQSLFGVQRGGAAAAGSAPQLAAATSQQGQGASSPLRPCAVGATVPHTSTPVAMPVAAAGSTPLMLAVQQVATLSRQLSDLRGQLKGLENAFDSDGIMARLAQHQEAMLEVEGTLAAAQVTTSERQLEFSEQLTSFVRSFEQKLDENRNWQARELKALKEQISMLEANAGTSNGAAGGKGFNGGAGDALAALPLPTLPQLPSGVKRSSEGLEVSEAEGGAKSQKVLLGGAAQDLLSGTTATKVVNARVSKLKAPESLPLAGLALEDVFGAFSAAGTIDKIVCFSAPMSGPPFEHVDAMVQYSSLEMAKTAIKSCSGLSLTQDGYNVTEVASSIQSELIVPNDSEQCRDYTRTRDFVAGGAGMYGRRDSQAPSMSVAGAHHQLELQGQTAASGGPQPVATPHTSRVITVHVRDLHLPNVAPLGGLTADMVGTAFKQFGTVEKIVMGPDQAPLPLAQLDAFVQFVTCEAARRAMTSAQGQSLTGDGYHNMQVELAALSELVVTNNSAMSWDYTAANLAVPNPGAVAQVRMA